MPTLTVDIAYDEPATGVSADPAGWVGTQEVISGTPSPWTEDHYLSGGIVAIPLDVGYYWVHRYGYSKLVHLTADARLDQLPPINPESLEPGVEPEPISAWHAELDELDDRVTAIEGGAGSGVQYVQGTPLASWLVPHTFGRLPNVAVYIGGEEVEADVTATTSQAVIAFASPQAGVAVLT